MDLGSEQQKQQTLFLKKVVIKNFLTYPECKLFVEDQLSPSCNLILGKNGSGKSSFLKAIIFVLSDRLSNLSKQQKRSFLSSLNQGQSAPSRARGQEVNENELSPFTNIKGHADPQTYWVEITLDNSLKRIPCEFSDLVIRKSYNCETDQEYYHMNGHTVTFKDLVNLFEAGNFSMTK